MEKYLIANHDLQHKLKINSERIIAMPDLLSSRKGLQRSDTDVEDVEDWGAAKKVWGQRRVNVLKIIKRGRALTHCRSVR